jgi:thioredoxin reductase
MSKKYDVIIIGGSYAGLSAAMALGRALRNVLIIDEGKPCNIQTPQSHNFVTQDGKAPLVIKEEALEQVLKYKTVKLKKYRAIKTEKLEGGGFRVMDNEGDTLETKKLLFATGIKDIMPDIKGFSECWGISILHCPYCHGYEVKQLETGVLANRDIGFEFTKMISNWTDKLTLYTNGEASLTNEQREKLEAKNINVDEKQIQEFIHENGSLKKLLFSDGSHTDLTVMYANVETKQHCNFPELLGCEHAESGLVEVNEFQQTSIGGVYAAGDCTNMFRSVALAVSSGSVAGAAINHELVNESF